MTSTYPADIHQTTPQGRIALGKEDATGSGMVTPSTSDFERNKVLDALNADTIDGIMFMEATSKHSPGTWSSLRATPPSPRRPHMPTCTRRSRARPVHVMKY